MVKVEEDEWKKYLEYLDAIDVEVEEENLKNLYISYLRFIAAYEFAKRIVDIDNKIVLEIGCAGGYGTNHLADIAAKVVGLDISRHAITFARSNCKKDNVYFVQTDGTKLPFESESFDVVVSFQVIEHIEPKFVLTYLTEIKRVLKADGIFICSTPNKKLRLLPFQKPWNPEHKKEYTSKEFKKLLNKVFENVKVYGLSASEEVLYIERARVKQDPFKVYVTSPLSRLLKVVLPSVLLVQLKEVGKRFISSKRSQNPIQQKDFLTKFSLEDFKVDSRCPDDCLDILGVCKKNIPPSGYGS